MKAIIIIFSYFFIHGISAYTLQRIDGIIGYASALDFDKEGNTYVASSWFFDRTNKSRLYQLNLSNEIVRTIDLPDYVKYVMAMRITRQGNTYFVFNNHGTPRSLELLTVNSTEIKKLDEISTSKFVFDKNENILYGKRNAGIHLIRANSSVPVPIANLENMLLAGDPSVTDPVYEIDQSGNIYLEVATGKWRAGIGRNENASVALITREALQEDIPRATFFNVFDNSNQHVEDLMIDNQNNLWITINEYRNSTDKKGIIKKFVDGKFETILIDPDHQILEIILAKDKIFVTAMNYSVASIYYITLNNVKVEIPELINLTKSESRINRVVDSEGNAYFSTNRYYSYGPLILIKPNEAIPVGSEFQIDFGIERMILDSNENLWFSSKYELYRLQKGKTNWEAVKNNSDEDCSLHKFNINFVTKKGYVSCIDGLYVVKSD